MTTSERHNPLPHLNGHHQQTYEAIFRHPTAHNLEWHDVRSLLAALGDVTEGHNGMLHMTRNGHAVSLHARGSKDVASVEDVLAIRHFLEQSDKAATPPPIAPGVHLAVVIDHHEAKIYRAELRGSIPQRIEPYDPHGFGRHLRTEVPETAGKREPERKSFYEAIAATLRGADAIVIFGNGTGESNAMEQLIADLKKHHHDVAEHIIGSVVIDEHHMTEGQLLAQAGKPSAVSSPAERLEKVLGQAHTDMNNLPMYPLRFEPIYQYRLWGGRNLADLLTAPLPGDGPIGEAWLLSDRDDHPSKVANGPLKGSTLRQLMEGSPEPLLGKLAARFRRFPVLLKFLDAQEKLSVQVHPEDGRTDEIPPGESGKTEAWVVLKASPNSQIYAGLKPGTTRGDLKQSLASGGVASLLASFTPKVGDAVFIRAGTVHSLAGVVVFEVQENSDVTFRLDDWDRVDPKTNRPRPLQVEQAIACVDFGQVAIGPVTPVVEEESPMRRERLFHCDHFSVWRHSGRSPFEIGAPGTPRVLVCIEGEGELEDRGTDYPVGRGDVMLLPAEVGACSYRPRNAVSVLEIALPE